MDRRDHKIVRELRKRLSEVVEPVDLRVFGARVDGDNYSDLDVFIEVPFIDRCLREAILEVVWEVSYENMVVISPLIFTREEIEESPLRSSPIVRNILRDGVVV